jgi:DNA-binding NtrC family response regulator
VGRGQRHAPAVRAAATETATGRGSLADRVRLASEAVEAGILQSTLAACGGNKAAAARALRIDYTTLHRKLKRLGLPGG